MSLWSRYAERFARGRSTERIVFFSDAVFAIAMTLLIVELHPPEVPNAELDEALLELIPGYLTFVLSFVVVGAIWISHHRKFTAIVRYDQGLIRLNVWMLLFVASLPLPTAILGLHGGTVIAVVIYAITIVAIEVLLMCIWIYAWHRGLVSEDVDRPLYRLMLVQSFSIPAVFLISIPVAVLWGATAGSLTWIAALPLGVLLPRLYARRAE